MERVILHIDFDSFFASVAQQYNPKLRNRPIGVTATNGLTCIIAASREAKKLGIKSPSRTMDAQKICPGIVFVTADFLKYWEISKKFISIAKDYSPYVEVFSIDEVFIDITKTAHLLGGVEEIVAQIKSRIKAEIGEYITVSVGISHNKLLAKLASGLKKPNGVFAIPQTDIESVYQKAKLTDICGIGVRICLRLNKIGIYSLLQLREASLSLLITEFGNVEGRFLKSVGLGLDTSPVIPYTTSPSVKSVGRNYCLPKNEYNQKIILQNVYELCEEIAIKLRRLSKKARTIGLNLRGSPYIHGRKTYRNATDSGKDIFKSCLSVLQKQSNSVYTRQISIWVSNLEDKIYVQESLFDVLNRAEKLTKTIDCINKKFGDHTIRNGFLLYADKLTTVPNGWTKSCKQRLIL